MKFLMVIILFSASAFAQSDRSAVRMKPAPKVFEDQLSIALVMNDLEKAMTSKETYNAPNYRTEGFVAAGLKVTKVEIETTPTTCNIVVSWGSDFHLTYPIDVSINEGGAFFNRCYGNVVD